MKTRQFQGCCYDCGRKYGNEYGFPDLIIPDDDWKKISPTKSEGGLLCPCCMIRRLELAEIHTTAKWTSGPFSK